MAKEYYIIYINKNGGKRHYSLYARTSREALSFFIANYEYIEVIKVIEWLNATNQIEHLVKDNKIITT